MGNNESNIQEEGIPTIRQHEIYKENSFSSTSQQNEQLQVKMIGEAESFRVYAHQDSLTQVSMWHDIKLFPEKNSKKNKIVNMICEIPKCSRKKYEIATKEPGIFCDIIITYHI